ncbi:MAG: TrmH family RNA methyltransferase [Candidatus Promineifilaceae bacterium]|nr:TrmH family RNA methyltransferase [Candidatus Promineifilaceae bacterium]
MMRCRQYSAGEGSDNGLLRVQSTHSLVAMLDNIRSAYNVGAMFRTADGAGVDHIFLCGITSTPAHPRVRKTALGAEGRVAWSHNNNSLEIAARLRSEGFLLWAVERSSRSTALPSVEDVSDTVALIVGNEVTGIDPELLSMADRCFHVPMYGVKGSLNVEVAFGLTAYQVRNALERCAAAR